MPNFEPRIRIEVYLPIRYEPAYQSTLDWLIRELTEVYGGCTVIENVGGYYLSLSQEIIDDRVSIVYSDLPLIWANQNDLDEVMHYCAKLQKFLLENLWEEAILVAAHPISHSQL